MEKQKYIPELRFPEFDEEWKKEKLGKILVEGRLGGNYENSESGKGIPVIKMGNLGRGDINIDKVQYLPKNEPYDNNDVLRDGDLLFNTRNTLELVGKVSIWRKELLFALYNSNLMRMKFNGDIESSNKFMNYNFNTKNSVRQLRRYATGTTSVAAIYGRDLKDFNVTFPSILEQKKIANFLTAIDEKLQVLKKKKVLLEQYKKGVMQKIFSGELRFKDENGNNFADWEVKKLGDIGDFSTSSVDKLFIDGEKEVFLVNYMNVYRHESISQKTISELQIVTAKDSQVVSSNLKKGDILFTPSSETPSDIGHSVVIFEDLEKCVYSYHLMRFRPKVKLNTLYSHYFCNIPSVLKQLSKLATGSTRFTISVKSFSSVEINLPHLAEQALIANFLATIDEKINQQQNQIEKVSHYKKGLLQQMFC